MESESTISWSQNHCPSHYTKQSSFSQLIPNCKYTVIAMSVSKVFITAKIILVGLEESNVYPTELT